MRIKLIVIGKTQSGFIGEGEAEYLKRLSHYVRVEKIEIPHLRKAKNMTSEMIKIEEGKLILSKIELGAKIVLLDENGVHFSSKQFSGWIQDRLNKGEKNVTFVVGGAYGFSQELYDNAHEKLSLSKMTFSHQMIRVLFLEQLYRAFTILKNEPYHNE